MLNIKEPEVCMYTYVHAKSRNVHNLRIQKLRTNIARAHSYGARTQGCAFSESGKCMPFSRLSSHVKVVKRICTDWYLIVLPELLLHPGTLAVHHHSNINIRLQNVHYLRTNVHGCYSSVT